MKHVTPHTATSLRRRAQRKSGVLAEVQTVVEGVRWVLFSDR